MLNLKSLPASDRVYVETHVVREFLSRAWIYLLRSPRPEVSRPRPMAPELELYAEASAPEGAYYGADRRDSYLPGSTGLYIGR